MPDYRAEYLLPLRWQQDRDAADLTEYLQRLSRWVDVTIVDGSEEPLFTAHALMWGDLARHLRPDVGPMANGKSAGVLTGLPLSRHEMVIIADDDVRYTRATIAAVLHLLETADLVHPQNVCTTWPWHARWDGARTLLNRAFGSDFSGTTAVRRSIALAGGGHGGNVLFENLELIRTVAASGGRVRYAGEVFVGRQPPTAAHFWSQRVRQAYDDFAQPPRLLRSLAILPCACVLSRCPRLLGVAVVAVIALAEVGRRKGGARRVFPADVPLWAPVWLAERGLCIWIALYCHLRGGVRYSGGRIKRAATAPAQLRRARRSVPNPSDGGTV